MLIQIDVASVKPYVKGALSAKSETYTYVHDKSSDVPSYAQKYAMLLFFLTVNNPVVGKIRFFGQKRQKGENFDWMMIIFYF